MDDCTRPHDARGLCPVHLRRAYRSGELQPLPKLTPADRLLLGRSITPSGCWEWTGMRDPKGYGYVTVPGKGSRRAHRVSYEEFVGPIPPGLCVMHACDNPPCINPSHLSVGTTRDNMHDMIRKGRANLSGLAAGHNPAVPDDVARAIVRDYDSGMGTFREVGARHGVSESTAHLHYHRIKRLAAS